MPFVGAFPVAQGPFNTPVNLAGPPVTATLGPDGPVGTVQTQLGGVPPMFASRSITWPKDNVTFTSGGVTVIINPSMQDPSSYVGQFNAAGIPVTIDIVGRLVFSAVSVAPTSNDANALKVLGVT